MTLTMKLSRRHVACLSYRSKQYSHACTHTHTKFRSDSKRHSIMVQTVTYRAALNHQIMTTNKQNHSPMKHEPLLPLCNLSDCNPNPHMTMLFQL